MSFSLRLLYYSAGGLSLLPKVLNSELRLPETSVASTCRCPQAYPIEDNQHGYLLHVFVH